MNARLVILLNIEQAGQRAANHEIMALPRFPWSQPVIVGVIDGEASDLDPDRIVLPAMLDHQPCLPCCPDILDRRMGLGEPLLFVIRAFLAEFRKAGIPQSCCHSLVRERVHAHTVDQRCDRPRGSNEIRQRFTGAFRRQPQQRICERRITRLEIGGLRVPRNQLVIRRLQRVDPGVRHPVCQIEVTRGLVVGSDIDFQDLVGGLGLPRQAGHRCRPHRNQEIPATGVRT